MTCKRGTKDVNSQFLLYVNHVTKLIRKKKWGTVSLHHLLGFSNNKNDYLLGKIPAVQGMFLRHNLKSYITVYNS